MLREAFCAGTIGGLLWLDRYQIGQLMISRPIVAGPVIGGALGDFSTGLAVGVLFEVLWLRRPPIGGFIAPDVTFASSVGTAAAVMVRNQTNFDVTALALLTFILFMPVSFLGSKLDLLLRVGLGKIAIPAEQAVLDRNKLQIALYFIASLALGFAICLVAQVPIILIGTLMLQKLSEAWPEKLIQSLKFAYFSIPALGALDMLAGNFERVPFALFLLGLTSTICCYFLL
ncbi:MAG: PTS sugar transporter subunit IIC [Deltaproteobacteria bacterium]|nr:PTS sugar transporter subunit IIC [Deltaproteobacteria bacterium]